jgi:hypothetical protein
MTCSARIPTYGLLIAAFLPGVGAVGHALVFLALYAAGILAGLVASLALRRTVTRGRSLPLAIEMPAYRAPDPRAVARAGANAATRFVRVHATLREMFTLANVSVACGAVLCVVGGAGAAYNVVTLRSFLGCAVYLVAGAYAVLSGSPRARNALRAHGLVLLPPSMRAALFEKYVVDVDVIFPPSPRVVFTRRCFPSVQVAARRAHRPRRAPGHRLYHGHDRRHGKCIAGPGGGGAVRGLGEGRGARPASRPHPAAALHLP